ncbi:uncharacterized mitochondrial protein AtMg00860-like [Solanum lycopersicum]|uniref:uncharacterized mitochondrial protein AtMg00860-like n=1 Tax=Solanum lycopersicum TaxID=4081 RepID=UPI0037487FC8
MLIYSSNEEDNANHLRIVLQRFKDKELYGKFSTCEFWIKSVAFLDNVVSGDGIRVDTQKIKAVQSWPNPTSPTNIRSFLGLDNYYRRLTEEIVKFQWSEAGEKNFQELKKRLTYCPNFDLKRKYSRFFGVL